ncbi:transposase [Nocardia yunnanensis]|uniref:Transposase n=1 Tax=Nocardia yunnanensis TaxID=2382165 RepID=A0A386ZFM0_9NOCA|nr:RNA-guided endonuclease TnpB family protein [Nocardia yunnanensis]AYF76411.1 transposase [Nocardia yunnanensis]
MRETVRYTFRVRPGKQAERALEAEWHRCRFLWNEAVHQYKTGGQPTYAKLSKMLTNARARSCWLREGSQVAQQQTLRNYGTALRNSFRVKGQGKPSFKSRKESLLSLEYTKRGFVVRDGRLRLAGGIEMPVVWSRLLPSEPTSVRIYRDSLGEWYGSFVVRREVTPAPAAQGSIGIDWGVSTTATTTNPQFDLPFGGHRERCAAQLAKCQRRMARRRRQRGQTPSKGYLKARRATARVYKKAARQNAYAVRNWARGVVNEHNLIAVEDFKSKFLTRSTMARRAADGAIGLAKKSLVERAVRAGRKVVLVPPAYTTMTCANCFARAKQQIALGVRTFRCEYCGHTANRDRNAARVILAVAESVHAGADDVRHAHLLSGS